MIEWSANEFNRKYDGVKIRDGQHLTEMLQAVGHTVIETTETSATIKALVGGLDMLIMMSIPANNDTIHAKPLFDTGIRIKGDGD